MPPVCMLSFVHPALPCLFFGAILLATMLAIHPVIATLSLVCALWLSLVTRGTYATKRTLAVTLPLMAIIFCINPLVSHAGSTVVATVLGIPVTLESLVYGWTMACVVAAVMVWCEDAACALNAESVMALFSRVLPRISLIVTMVARLVPTYIRRNAMIQNTEEANRVVFGHHARRPTSSLSRIVRRSGILLAWSLESSIQKADAMVAQGWNAKKKRSSYRIMTLGRRDIIALVLLSIGIVCITVALAMMCTNYSFYPYIHSLNDAPSFVAYVLFAIFATLPSIFQIIEVHTWIR